MYKGLIAILIVCFAVVGFAGAKELVLDELDCEELAVSYVFNSTVLTDIVTQHNECLAHSKLEEAGEYTDLYCSFINVHSQFIRNVVRELMDRYEAKCHDGEPEITL